MKKYRIEYTDADPDSGCPTFRCVIRAEDAYHAEELFLEGEDADGWVVLKVTEIK